MFKKLKEIYFKLIFFFLALFLLPLTVKAEQKSKCFKIDLVEIKGSYSLSNKQIRNIKNKYENKCLKIENMQDLVKEITNAYIQEGYITSRASIPEQDLRDQKLVIKIHEGYIESIEQQKDKIISANIFPTKKGKILNLRDIEQGIDHLNRLKSNNITISLKPGNRQYASKIIIENQPKKRWHIVTGVDNSGNKHKGRTQSFNILNLENIIGLNEIYSFGQRQSLADSDEKFMRSSSAMMLVPYGYNNFSISYNQASYRNFIQATRNKYQNKGGSKVAKFTVDRVVHRDSNSRTNIIFGFGYDDYSNYLADNKIEISTYRLHKFDFGLRQQRRFESSVLGWGLIFTHGENHNYMLNFGNIATPSKRFQKLNYDASWLKPLPFLHVKPKYQVTILGQVSQKLLCGTEKDTVGGLNSIRGFKENIENADSTLIARNELIADLATMGPDKFIKLFGDINIFAALDWGIFINNEENGTRRGVMSGTAIGIRNNNGMVKFDITLARALRAPVFIQHPVVFYFSFSLNI